MTISPVNLILSLGLAEAVLALVFSLLFFGFHRLYRRTHLRYWSYSFLGLTVYSAVSVFSVFSAANFGENPYLRTL